VALSDELTGKSNLESLLPQYFITAMFTGAEQVVTLRKGIDCFFFKKKFGLKLVLPFR
jgi:hypothetical protein